MMINWFEKNPKGRTEMKFPKYFFALTLAFVFLTAVSASAASEIICASTTSTENSGLFGYILPMFEKNTGIKVKVVARGTGAAIEMGKRGDADVFLSMQRSRN